MQRLNNSTTNSRISCWLTAAALLLLPQTIFAQEDDEGIFTLSAFTVSAEDSAGYVSDKSVGASLLVSPLDELPVSVNVLTQELLEDIDVQYLEDAVQYVSGTSNEGRNFTGESTFSIRGLPTNLVLRNGMYYNGKVDLASIERVEVVKGPQSIVFGQADPGGFIHYTSKQPIAGNEFGQVKATLGDYSMKHLAFDYNKPIDEEGQFVFRVSGGWLDTETEIPFEERNEFSITPTMAWNPTENTRIVAEYNLTQKDGNYNFVVVPLFRSRGGGNNPPSVELVPVDRKFSNLFPENELDQENHFWNLRVEHKFNDNLVGQFSYGYADQTYLHYFVQGGQINQFREDSPPYTWNGGLGAYQDMKTQEIFQANLAYQFDIGETNHRLMLNLRRFEAANSGDLKWLDLDGDGNRDRLSGLVGGSGFQVLPWEPSDNESVVTPLPSDFWANPDQYVWEGNHARGWGSYDPLITDPFIPSISLVDQIKAMNGDLILLLGVRKTWDRQMDVTNAIVRAQDPNAALNDTSGTTPTVGVTYKANDNINLYAMYSESYTPNGRVGGNSEPWYIAQRGYFPTETGEGAELGFKFNFLENKLNGTVSVFDITKNNVQFGAPQLNPDATGGSGVFGEQQSSGWELDFTYSPESNWDLVFSYTNMDARTTQARIGNATPDIDGDGISDMVGLVNEGAAKHHMTFFTKRVVVEGPLKGWEGRFGLKYKSGPIHQFANFHNQLLVQPDNVVVMDAAVAYNTKVGENDLQFALAVNNLTDEDWYDRRAKYAGPIWTKFTTTFKF